MWLLPKGKKSRWTRVYESVSTCVVLNRSNCIKWISSNKCHVQNIKTNEDKPLFPLTVETFTSSFHCQTASLKLWSQHLRHMTQVTLDLWPSEFMHLGSFQVNTSASLWAFYISGGTTRNVMDEERSKGKDDWRKAEEKRNPSPFLYPFSSSHLCHLLHSPVHSEFMISSTVCLSDIHTSFYCVFSPEIHLNIQLHILVQNTITKKKWGPLSTYFDCISVDLFLWWCQWNLLKMKHLKHSVHVPSSIYDNWSHLESITARSCLLFFVLHLFGEGRGCVFLWRLCDFALTTQMTFAVMLRKSKTLGVLSRSFSWPRSVLFKVFPKH